MSTGHRPFCTLSPVCPESRSVLFLASRPIKPPKCDKIQLQEGILMSVRIYVFLLVTVSAPRYPLIYSGALYDANKYPKLSSLQDPDQDLP